MTLISTSLPQCQYSVICIMVMILWWRTYQIRHILTSRTTRYSLMLACYLCRWAPCSVLSLRCRASANSSASCQLSQILLASFNAYRWRILLTSSSSMVHHQASCFWQMSDPSFYEKYSTKSAICTLCLDRKILQVMKHLAPQSLIKLHELEKFSVTIACWRTSYLIVAYQE